MAEPKCKYYGMCGGCNCQHIDYNIQLENKKKQLINAINYEDVNVFSDNDYGYRNRMDLIFHKAGVGFRKKGDWKSFVDIENCAIANDKLNVLLKEIRDYFKRVDAFDIRKQCGTFKYAVIRTPSLTSSISFVINEESKQLGEAIDMIKEFAKISTAENIVVTYAPRKTDTSISEDYFVVKGNKDLKESLMGKEFHYNVQGFFQNNTVMAEKMHIYVNDLIKKYDTKDMRLLDLYGGVGTFGIINSSLFKDVITLESFQGCTDSAKENIEINNVSKIQAICKDAKQLYKLELKNPLFVITDPPRSGMIPKTIQALNEIKPQVIIYVSCNVTQLAREIGKFKDYEIKSAAIFDLFPQTNHMEAVVELVVSSLT